MSMRNDLNEECRQRWLSDTLKAVPAGWRILDAGAGRLKNRVHCRHLDYVSQDFCQYDETMKNLHGGLHTDGWSEGHIDLVCDITKIPVENETFDVILCSEVLEHIPDPMIALDEFFRILRPEGILILTAPFASVVHMAPYYYYSGFSKYWYQHHLTRRGFVIDELTPLGGWYELIGQEISRLGSLERSLRSWTWPLAYIYSFVSVRYFKSRRRQTFSELASLGWHCKAKKSQMGAKPSAKRMEWRT